MSRISSGIPIFAFSRNEETLNRVTIYRGVFPVHFPFESVDKIEINRNIINKLKARNHAQKGDQFIITKGDLDGQPGGTNSMKVVIVGEGLTP